MRQAWRAERALVEATGQGTRLWSEGEKAELLRFGRVNGYEGHHIRSVKAFPELAGEPSNVEFVTRAEHFFDRHGGNWRNPTNGELVNRALP